MRHFFLLIGGCLLVACGPPDDATVEQPDLPPTYLGSAACGQCHTAEFDAWRDSHHALAMQVANADTVLGDFSGASIEHFGVISTFNVRDGRFIVSTDGADGDLQDFAVKYTFGVTPLQQYLVEFPGGRLQALPLAWDSRNADQGGQRWFHLYPDEAIDHTDVLHWTGPQQNWNYMCAECHSTNLEKNYSAATDSFATAWSEIDVGCEACHGPGSRHVAQAERHEFTGRAGLLTDLDDTGRATWQMNADTGIAARSDARLRPPAQPEACGRCHSRRSVLTAEYAFDRPLLDTHLPSLLDAGLYFDDGQIHEEVYVYGSFLQSRMYQAGVSCTDCHEPHSARLRTSGEPSNICATCHLPARFATSEHHHHPPATVACVDCHMPSRNFMVVDGRRDHSFRIPRPDLTLAAGSPNACNQCHDDRNASWAEQAYTDWFGDDAPDHYGFALHTARIGGGNQPLLGVVANLAYPGIARGTALAELRPPYSQDVARVIQGALQNGDPFVRLGGIRALSGLPPDLQVGWAAPLLEDRLRAIRIAAARLVAPLRSQLPANVEGAFRAAEMELRDSMLAIAERPEAQSDLGNLYFESGDAGRAEAAFQQALRIAPRTVGARVNLADLYRRLGREGDAEALLREGIESEPGAAAYHHSLGLLLVRKQQQEEALLELQQAATLEPGNPRYLYVYAIALNSLGRAGEAIALLTETGAAFPGDFDIQWALATMLRDQRRDEEARSVATALATIYPGIAPLQALLDNL